MNSYTIEISQGCTAFWTKINDKFIEDLSHEELHALLEHLCLKLKEGVLDGTVSLDSVIGCFQYVDYEHDGRICDQCGDSVTKTKWII